MLKSSQNAYDMKDSTNGKEPIKTLKTKKLDSRKRKPKGSDINQSNIYGDQATHFVSCIESPNPPNFLCNRKKVGNMFEARPTM